MAANPFTQEELEEIFDFPDYEVWPLFFDDLDITWEEHRALCEPYECPSPQNEEEEDDYILPLLFQLLLNN